MTGTSPEDFDDGGNPFDDTKDATALVPGSRREGEATAELLADMALDATLVGTSRVSDEAAAEAERQLAEVSAIVEVTTAEAYTALCQQQRAVREALDAIEIDKAEMVRPFKTKIEAVNERVARVVKPLKAIDAAITPLTTAYETIAERARVAEETRLRIEATAEAKRQQEADAKALERQALAERKKGNVGVARELQQQATATREETVHVSVHVESSVPAAGMTTGYTWGAEVFGFMELIKAVAAGLVEADALLPNEKYLNKQATARQDGMNIANVPVPGSRKKRLVYPGVHAVKKPYKKRGK